MIPSPLMSKGGIEGGLDAVTRYSLRLALLAPPFSSPSERGGKSGCVAKGGMSIPLVPLRFAKGEIPRCARNDSRGGSRTAPTILLLCEPSASRFAGTPFSSPSERGREGDLLRAEGWIFEICSILGLQFDDSCCIITNSTIVLLVAASVEAALMRSRSRDEDGLRCCGAWQ